MAFELTLPFQRVAVLVTWFWITLVRSLPDEMEETQLGSCECHCDERPHREAKIWPIALLKLTTKV
jgi:hypothetical protein